MHSINGLFVLGVFLLSVLIVIAGRGLRKIYRVLKAMDASVALHRWMRRHQGMKPADWPEGRALIERAIDTLELVQREDGYRRAARLLPRLYRLRDGGLPSRPY